MRLIDADELIKKLEFNSWDIDEWELPHEQVSAGLRANAYDRKTVEDAPTVDAVPVVRCKDCMFYSKELEACWESEYEDLRRWKPDDFCSKGERKRRMKEVIVNAEDLVCLNKEKLQKLIRCKDCKWYVHNEGVCKLHSNNYEPSVKMETDDFCSRAERKEE